MTCDWVDSWSKVPKAFHVPNTTSNCSLFISSASYLSSPCLGVRRDAQGPRNRGTKTEALSLLGLFLPFSVINLFLLLHSVFLFKIVLSPNLNAHLLGKKPHQYLWSTLWHCYLLLKSPFNAFLYFIAVAVAVIAITGQMVFCEDEKVGISSLHHLLWCAVTDDFEVRSKAVAMIIGWERVDWF